MEINRNLKTCLLALLLAIITQSVWAQGQTVSIHLQKASLKQVFNAVEKQTTYRFSYRSATVDNRRDISVNVTNGTVNQVLDIALVGRNLKYKIVSSKVIAITEKEAASHQLEKTPLPTNHIHVNGLIIDEGGEPLIGVTVSERGTTNRAVTNLEGRFEIEVEKGHSLEFSYIGYLSQTLSVKPNMTVRMSPDNHNLDEIVVIGYGNSKRRDLIASVSTVKTDELTNVPVSNITQGLAGRSPGLVIKASGGGIDPIPYITIRGGEVPLYVIDGVVRSQTDFANLLPEDIESMSILKDASATAIYGSRASNGIIQIQTKTGKAGRTSVDYDFNVSMAQPANWPEQLSAYDRAYYANVARKNDGLDPIFSDEIMQKIKDGSDPQNYNSTNWRDITLRKWAPQIKNAIRITGGNEKTNFFASLGRIDQNSLYRSGTHWMKRTNFRIGGATNLQEIGLKISASIDGYVQSVNHPYTSKISSYREVFRGVNDGNLFSPAYNNLGLFYNQNTNIAAEISKDAGFIRTKKNVVNGKGELLWSLPWIKGMYVRLSSNYRFFYNSIKSWRKDPATYAWDSEEPSYASISQLQHESNAGYAFTNQAFVGYDKTFGHHNISALFGYEQYYEKNEDYWAKRENFTFNIPQLEIGDANAQTNGGKDDIELGRAAWIGQLKYNYANKYYVEGSFRYDGSDYFRKDKRWGLFFSGSLGWVVTEEAFMKPFVERNIFNSLKLRGSYGETGLDSDAGRWAYMTSYSMNPKGQIVGGKYVPTFAEGALASPDLTWYTTRELDFGFDFSSLGNRLYGSFDYFYYATRGYLVAPKGKSYLGTALGVGMPKIKSDSERRRAGYEIQLGWRSNIGAFKYDILANYTHFDALWALDEREGESSAKNPYQRWQQHKGYFDVIYRNLGYYRSAEDVYNSVAFLPGINSGNLTAGDIKYWDANGDGRITEEDMRRLGKSKLPRGQWGINISLSYKGFYFSTLFQGSTRFDMYIPGSAAMRTDQSGAVSTKFPYQLDTWKPDNTNAHYPRLMSNTNRNSNNNYIYSDFWLVNGAYLRMKDFQLGYDLKYSLAKRVHWLTRARVGVSGQNIFTISQATKYGLDPENSSTENYGYPVERTLAFTLNLGF